MDVLYGDYEHENSEVLCAFHEIPSVEVLRERIEMSGNGSWFEPPEMSDDVLQKLIDTGETALKWKYSSYYLYLKKGGGGMMYRLFANVEYSNGDFERRILDDFLYRRDGEDILKLHKEHWDTNKDQYEKVTGLTFELEAWE